MDGDSVAEVAALAEQIAGRALEAQCDGEYIGLFEWIAWGVMQSVGVQMLFGNHVVDLMAWFAPMFAVENPAVVTRVCAVLLQDGGAWRAAFSDDGFLPRINHFVLGIIIGGASVHVNSGLDSATRLLAPKCAIAAGMEAGWLLSPTIANGDCGIDVMAATAKLERRLASWQSIRKEYMILFCCARPQKCNPADCCSTLVALCPFAFKFGASLHLAPITVQQA